MSPEQKDFLNQRHLPSRLTARETGWLLGFSISDIKVLTSHRLLKPVGRPSQNSSKYYSTAQTERLRRNVKWLNRATAVTNQHWKDKYDNRDKGDSKP